MAGAWTVQAAERSEQTRAILDFLLGEYRRIFGTHVMHNADCVVYNDPTAGGPRFIHADPYKIRLSQTSLGYWSQTVYQLSHEMCHFAMHQTKRDRKFILSWFEETVCEAVSLYALDFASREWYRCGLSRISPDFYRHHRDYLEGLLANVATDGLARCNTVELLRNAEKMKLAESDRASHVRERNALFRAILLNPLEVRYILDYQWYLNADGVTINFERWLTDNPCNLIRQLSEIQPVRG